MIFTSRTLQSSRTEVLKKKKKKKSVSTDSEHIASRLFPFHVNILVRMEALINYPAVLCNSENGIVGFLSAYSDQD